MCEEVVKEEMGETENEAKTGEIGMKEESGKRQTSFASLLGLVYSAANS